VDNYKSELARQIKSGRKREEIIRSLYLIRPTFSFLSNYVCAEEILVEVSSFFNIPINKILVCGSAKIGFSLYKGTDFIPGYSDLDLAIVDADLFSKYFDIVLKETNAYNKQTMFKDSEVAKRYIGGVSKGCINPKNMPNIDKKVEINDFFSTLSQRYRNIYASISVCFYLSEASFQRKQQTALHTWVSNFNQNLIGVGV
jgi:hypothetical protein